MAIASNEHGLIRAGQLHHAEPAPRRPLRLRRYLRQRSATRRNLEDVVLVVAAIVQRGAIGPSKREDSPIMEDHRSVAMPPCPRRRRRRRLAPLHRDVRALRAARHAAEQRGENRGAAPAVAVDANEHDPGAERDGAGAERAANLDRPSGGAAFPAAARMWGWRSMKSCLNCVGDGAPLLRTGRGGGSRRRWEVLRVEDAGAGEGEDGDDDAVRRVGGCCRHVIAASRGNASPSKQTRLPLRRAEVPLEVLKEGAALAPVHR